MEKYIGPYKVKKERKIDKESCLVSFESYTTDQGQTFQPPSREYTYQMLGQIVTEEPSDFTTLMSIMYTPLVDQIVEKMVAYDMNIGFRDNIANDLGRVLKMVENKISNWRDVYEDRLWGAEEAEKTLRQLVKGLSTVSNEIQELKVIKPLPKDSE